MDPSPAENVAATWHRSTSESPEAGTQRESRYPSQTKKGGLGLLLSDESPVPMECDCPEHPARAIAFGLEAVHHSRERGNAARPFQSRAVCSCPLVLSLSKDALVVRQAHHERNLWRLSKRAWEIQWSESVVSFKSWPISRLWTPAFAGVTIE